MKSIPSGRSTPKEIFLDVLQWVTSIPGKGTHLLVVSMASARNSPCKNAMLPFYVCIWLAYEGLPFSYDIFKAKHAELLRRISRAKRAEDNGHEHHSVNNMLVMDVKSHSRVSVSKLAKFFRRVGIPISLTKVAGLCQELLGHYNIKEKKVLLLLGQVTHWRFHCGELGVPFALRPADALLLVKEGVTRLVDKDGNVLTTTDEMSSAADQGKVWENGWDFGGKKKAVLAVLAQARGGE